MFKINLYFSFFITFLHDLVSHTLEVSVLTIRREKIMRDIKLGSKRKNEYFFQK